MNKIRAMVIWPLQIPKRMWTIGHARRLIVGEILFYIHGLSYDGYGFKSKILILRLHYRTLGVVQHLIASFSTSINYPFHAWCQESNRLINGCQFLVGCNWLPWGAWSACQGYCGIAMQTRTRRCNGCLPGEGRCQGDCNIYRYEMQFNFARRTSWPEPGGYTIGFF